MDTDCVGIGRMNNLNILFHGEVQLIDWGESRAGGPWLKIRLADPSELDPFRGLDTAGRNKTGHILHVTIAEGDIAAIAESGKAATPEKPENPYGEASALLWKSAFFRMPDVWGALGVRATCEAEAKSGQVKAAQTRAWETFKRLFGYASMADVPPSVVIEWARENSLEQRLPSGYREWQS